MRYLALATDYDGTLAKDGQVDESTLTALERFRDSGRRLILVTGRELDELLEVFPQIDLFERVVAENGALLYRPAGREQKVLGEAPPPELVETIRKKGVESALGGERDHRHRRAASGRRPRGDPRAGARVAGDLQQRVRHGAPVRA